MIVLGGEGTKDIKDFWALDLDSKVWVCPDVFYNGKYTAKRFHTASTINNS
jgi:hypothetical protein